jgi:hypothetical protein
MPSAVKRATITGDAPAQSTQSATEEHPAVALRPDADALTAQPLTRDEASVTARSCAIGLLLSVGLAALHCWVETAYEVSFLGGIHLPFGAVFLLLLLLGFNVLRRLLGSVFSSGGTIQDRLVPTDSHVGTPQRHLFRPLSSVELVTIYSMLLFAALVSTSGTYNFFVTISSGLFYYSTPENGWANLFYSHVPSWFAPGWDGTTYQRDVIEPLYTGGMSLGRIPWHAWTAMLIAWSIFLLLIYGTLFFVSLLLRRQWIESEALSFPLLQLPLQMIESDDRRLSPPSRDFLNNRQIWLGFVIAAGFHFLRGMNHLSPDWPVVASFQGNTVGFSFTEQPWLAIGQIGAELWLGAVGISYLLTREVSFSLWFFFLFSKMQLVFATQAGFPVGSLPKDTYLGRPTFITYQSIGGWLAVGIMLLWIARVPISDMVREALGANKRGQNEPFAPRFVVMGLALCLTGLLFWSWFAGLNLLVAVLFFGIYLLCSIVLARLVVEAGFLFPQLTFSPMEWMTGGILGGQVASAATMTKLSFLQPVLMSDARTNILPAFLHTFKLAHVHRLDTRNMRRLLGAISVATVAALAVTLFTSVATLYSRGGLTSYGWFARDATQTVFGGAASMIKSPLGLEPLNLGWIGIGSAAVWLMTLARSRFLWFPLHPLGYIIASGYPMGRLWFSIFLGWGIKSLVMRFGGQEANLQVRGLMIGLILGNIVAMVLWLLLSAWTGSRVSYWPA